MGGGAGSVSFERAAEVYDRTRLTDPVALAGALDLLDRVLPSSRVLEIGVGTGAIAVPLAERGRRVIGLDVSKAMLERLRAKEGAGGVAVAIADATRLPVADGAFRGAYCRWVLHLIASWREAVRELCRVVASGGVIVVEPGGTRAVGARSGCGSSRSSARPPNRSVSTFAAGTSISTRRSPPPARPSGR